MEVFEVVVLGIAVLWATGFVFAVALCASARHGDSGHRLVARPSSPAHGAAELTSEPSIP